MQTEETSTQLTGVEQFTPPVPSPVATSVGVVVGVLVACNEDGSIWVMHPHQSEYTALAALTIADLRADDVGKNVLLAFENGDLHRPVVLGPLRAAGRAARNGTKIPLEIDGERLVVSAREQLVLQCGQARITLTAAGKVIIDGTYVVSRSSGENKIKGARIELN